MKPVPRVSLAVFRRYLASFTTPGLAVALWFGGASFGPSLLPRGWQVQALLLAVSAASGYLVATLFVWLGRELIPWRPSFLVSRTWLLAALSAWFGVAAVRGAQSQTELALALGIRPSVWQWLPLIGFGVVGCWLLVSLGRLVARGFRWVHARLSPRLPDRLSAPVSVLVVGVLLIGVNNNLIWRESVNYIDESFAALNNQTPKGSRQPTSPLRSGSANSAATWQSLGLQGRGFVASGPTRWRLTQFSNAPAKTPIRIYAGLQSASSLQARARLVVTELLRTKAAERAVWLVVMPTGTGMVDPGAAEALEYLYNGDTAVMSMQYSYLPSWVSFLIDIEKPKTAGRILFEAVYEQWQTIPESKRPKLLISGTSLGVLGGEAAFTSISDLRARTDGAVWAGAPIVSELHSQLTNERDSGSTFAMPVVDRGAKVRFATRSTDLGEPRAEWQFPRVVYLQNASDPIVRWSPELIWSRPDWIAEPAPNRSAPKLNFLPWITFLQVTGDLPISLSVDSGLGHNYRNEFVSAWAKVLPPAGWGDSQTARLLAYLASQ